MANLAVFIHLDNIVYWHTIQASARNILGKWEFFFMLLSLLLYISVYQNITIVDSFVTSLIQNFPIRNYKFLNTCYQTQNLESFTGMLMSCYINY